MFFAGWRFFSWVVGARILAAIQGKKANFPGNRPIRLAKIANYQNQHTASCIHILFFCMCSNDSLVDQLNQTFVWLRVPYQ